jgi:hypothetical protein
MYGGIVTAEKIKISKELKDYNLDQIKNDYNNLQNSKDNDIKTLYGNKFLDYYFFPYRLDTKTKRKINFYDFLENQDEYIDKKTLNKLISYNNKFRSSMTKMDILYHYFQLYFGSVNQFKPILAKSIYMKYQPKVVLDFAASWGGRLLGAMALPNIKYIGIDINKDLKKPYDKMIKDLKVEKKVKMIYEDSANVDYSRYKYDMVFTSPPYYNKEFTEYMPEYKTYSEFIYDYLLPTINNSYKYLEKGGHYILILNERLAEDVIKVLGKPNTILDHQLSNRKYTGKEYKESIYIWKKE